MSRFYGDAATATRLATREAKGTAFIAVLQALAAHLLAHPGLALPHIGGFRGDRLSIQISGIYYGAHGHTDITALVGWARSLGVPTATARRITDSHHAYVHVHLHVDLDGVPVDIWTGVRELTDSTVEDQAVLLVDDLDAAHGLAGDFAAALAHVQSATVS